MFFTHIKVTDLNKIKLGLRKAEEKTPVFNGWRLPTNHTVKIHSALAWPGSAKKEEKGLIKEGGKPQTRTRGREEEVREGATHIVTQTNGWLRPQGRQQLEQSNVSTKNHFRACVY